MRLADFILANTEPILAEWEAFARDIWPGSMTDRATLRDDAADVLRATAADMRTGQTATQQADKSKGRSRGGVGSLHSARIDRASVAHGRDRHGWGFDLPEVIAEYRALRACVVRLWRASRPSPDLRDLDDLTRFHESIDQSLTEAVVAFTQIVERERLAALDVHTRLSDELREMNDALLVSLARQHELTEHGEKTAAALRASQEDYRLIAERQKLLAAELSHRVKNTLATVQAIASQTRRFATTADEFDAKFSARIHMLARAHGLLTKTSWEGAMVADIVRSIIRPLAPFPDRDVTIEGPEVFLSSNQVLALSMILHELSTNAVKYGSLSKPGGNLAIRWVDGQGELKMRWQEAGGPTVSHPSRRGFGTSLIERIASFELQGSARLSYDQDGVECAIEFPLGRRMAAGCVPT